MARDVAYKPPTTGPTATIGLSAPQYAGSNLVRNAMCARQKAAQIGASKE